MPRDGSQENEDDREIGIQSRTSKGEAFRGEFHREFNETGSSTDICDVVASRNGVAHSAKDMMYQKIENRSAITTWSGQSRYQDSSSRTHFSSPCFAGFAFLLVFGITFGADNSLTRRTRVVDSEIRRSLFTGEFYHLAKQVPEYTHKKLPKKKNYEGFTYRVNIIGCTAPQHLSVSAQESGRLHSLAHGYTTPFTVLTGTPSLTPSQFQCDGLTASNFLDFGDSTFYQGFLWEIAISHLLLPQRLDTLLLHQGSCDELCTPEAKQHLVQKILIYTKLSGHNRWWRQGQSPGPHEYRKWSLPLESQNLRAGCVVWYFSTGHSLKTSELSWFQPNGLLSGEWGVEDPAALRFLRATASHAACSTACEATLHTIKCSFNSGTCRQNDEELGAVLF
ncbi:hypothetical protein M405DRAFT_883565 [Rhizopogon salebrosus TDB-379]|nr:hypothetical protein M405DRAFT_883565 [Rhizopogon salebrosus TDB-379]